MHTVLMMLTLALAIIYDFDDRIERKLGRAVKIQKSKRNAIETETRADIENATLCRNKETKIQRSCFVARSSLLWHGTCKCLTRPRKVFCKSIVLGPDTGIWNLVGFVP